MDLDECENCGAGLISVSDICPQCGFLKSKDTKLDEAEENVADEIKFDKSEEKPKNVVTENHKEFVGNVADDIKNPSKKKSIKVKNKISRPAGIRLISISYMLFGISLVLFGIIYVSAVMFLVMSDAMGELGAIGGGMGNMPMLPGMGGIDASTKSTLGNIIDLNRIGGLDYTFSASEIELFLRSTGSGGIMNMDLMMVIIWDAALVALIEIGIGAAAFVMGLGMFKGKKLARLVVIVDSIISIPLVVIFTTVDVLVILGMVAVNGVVLTYMLKSKAREYFNQPTIKKSKTKNSQTIKKSQK